MKSLLECALDNGPHLIVGVRRGTGGVRRVGFEARRLERGDTRDDVEVVEVDPGRAGEDGAVLAVIGEGDQIENGGVAHIEALMAEIHAGVDHRAIGRGVDVDDERLGRGRRCILRGGRGLRKKNGGEGSEKKSDSKAEDLHKGSIEKRGRDEVARLRRSETRLDRRTIMLCSGGGCKGAGCAVMRNESQDRR